MERIDYLIQRYLDGKETEAERDELMAIVASGDHRQTIESKFAEGLTRRMHEGGDIDEDALRHELGEIRSGMRLKPAKEGKVVFLTRRFRVAAAISALMALSYLTWQYGASVYDLAINGEVTAVTSTSGVKKVFLSDGSIVWLKGNSMLTYPTVFGREQRHVSLRGEALFEVAKDAAHPFVIDCGAVTTTVLGTSFNIRTDEQNTEVMVLTGKVSVRSKNAPEAVIVMPNEKIMYSHVQEEVAREAVASEDAAAVFTGTEYNMFFEDTPLREVARQIEGKFNIQVTMSDPALGNCLITADFTDQSLDLTLGVIGKSLGLQYQINKTKVTLSGTGCAPDVKPN